jgi:hypothetical protein
VGFWKWPWRRTPSEDPRLSEWVRRWTAAAATLDPASAQQLRRELESFGLSDEDVEIEREMLDALEDGAALASELARSGLPALDTGHRVVGHDRCHFTAAVSMPDEASQPSGRLLLTNARAIFAGGAHAVSTPWHMIGEARHVDRDLVLVRTTRDRVSRFRCNSFSDVIRATLIARELIGKRRV